MAKVFFKPEFLWLVSELSVTITDLGNMPTCVSTAVVFLHGDLTTLKAGSNKLKVHAVSGC